MLELWVEELYDRFVIEKPNISNVKEVAVDEIYNYYQEKLRNYGSGKLPIIEVKIPWGRLLDIVIQKP